MPIGSHATNALPATGPRIARTGKGQRPGRRRGGGGGNGLGLHGGRRAESETGRKKRGNDAE